VCPLCSSSTEDTWHALWSCPAAVAVWQDCPRRLQKLSLQESDGLGLFLQLRDRLQDEELLLALTVAPHIWLRQNYVVFDRATSHPSQVSCFAIEDLESFKTACSLPARREPIQRTRGLP
jgi:hypothetical protein